MAAAARLNAGAAAGRRTDMASTLRRAAALLRVPGNHLGFALRSRLRWSRGAPALANADKAALFAHLDGDDRLAAAAEELQLRRRYELAALWARSTLLVYGDNLSLLRGLQRLGEGVALPDAARLCALDIGCGDFRYATALQRWLRWHGAATPRTVLLRGIEIDGHGIYRDRHSRCDHGRAHAALAGADVRYEVGDGSRLGEVATQHVVKLLYPFLLAYPLLRWGLPLQHYRPRRLLTAAVTALLPGGLLLVANQTATEFERLQRLLAAQPVELLARCGLADARVPFAARVADRQGSIWRRL